MESFLPGLSSTVAKTASGEIKATMKVRVAMVELWQVVLRNVFSSYETRLNKRAQESKNKMKAQMLKISSRTSADELDEEDEF